MIPQLRNPYENPFLSDNELCLRAEFLIKDLNNTVYKVEKLLDEGGDIDHIESLCDRCDVIKRELRLVQSSLMENSFDVSRDLI
ncbi:hypothetical protein [Vibrio sp. TRT 29B02]|uniref:hypothetical protein n=1 Tax=Vibrio sp. TRT 29B02 TaxID=3418508 RepID=UPI003CE692F0